MAAAFSATTTAAFMQPLFLNSTAATAASSRSTERALFAHQGFSFLGSTGPAHKLCLSRSCILPPSSPSSTARRRAAVVSVSEAVKEKNTAVTSASVTNLVRYRLYCHKDISLHLIFFIWDDASTYCG